MFTAYLMEQGIYDKLKSGSLDKELIFELKLVLQLGGFSMNSTDFWNYAKAEFPNVLFRGMTVPEPQRIINGIKEFQSEPWYQKAARLLCTKTTDKQDEDMHNMLDVLEKYWTPSLFNKGDMISLVGQEYSIKPEFKEELGEVFSGPNADRPREGLMLKNESYQGFSVLNILWIADKVDSYEIIKGEGCKVSGGRPSGELIRFKGKITKEQLEAKIFFLPQLKKETKKKDFDKKYPCHSYQTDLGAFKALPTVEEYFKANGIDIQRFKRMTGKEFLLENSGSYTHAVLARYADKIFGVGVDKTN